MTNERLEGKRGRYRLEELLVSEEGLNIYLEKRSKKKWSARQTKTRNIAGLICVGKFDPRISSGKYDLREEGSIVLDNTLLGTLPPPQPLPYHDTLRHDRRVVDAGGITKAMKRYKVCRALLSPKTHHPVKLLSEVSIPLERQDTLIASLPHEVVGAKSRRKIQIRDEELHFHYEDNVLVGSFFVVWDVYLRPPIPSRQGNFPEWIRQALLGAAGYKCQVCGSTDNLEVDHILPVYQGGEGTIENGRVLCRSCHKAKTRADRTQQGW